MLSAVIMVIFTWIVAIVTLLNGDEVEDVVSLFNDQELLGTKVDVSLYPNDNLLCVAHLPFNLDDQGFHAMVADYGAIERCFLMRNWQGQSSHKCFFKYRF